MTQHQLTWLSRWGKITAQTLLIATLGVAVFDIPAFADIPPEQIEQRMSQLKNSNQRWLEINITTQRLIAWEGNNSVYAIVVATGKPATPTETGMFTLENKQPLARLRGSSFDVPDVPYVLYYEGGGAIHGAYWLNRFGRPVSHGTTYLAVNHARWLYNWATIGMPIIVRE
ncbi:MAG: L,D-transpeptidase [Jaaginema sp. PMC 1079.18]|nr:L,D-transpeptidase [Jaaginema sp. PMC 1080.18]MEC4850474.1 L,D-transpeptidase [Jaaginema sp. PMC 1079.18]MEC4866576.1 L,D-transpeptidase [Jaaginema sp. PMC 1078.18]